MRPAAIGFFLVLNVLLRGYFFHVENSGLTIDKLSNPDEGNYLTYARELLEQGPAWLFTERALSGHGVPVVLVGVTSHQGARESRAQGEVAQVAGWPGAVRYARCGAPKQDWLSFERCSERPLES